MANNHKSNTAEQVEAGVVLFQMTEQWLGVKLQQNPHIMMGSTFMEPDFYSEDAGVIGEIFAHFGKPKKAQNNKIANDMLRILLAEKRLKQIFRKILVVCDEEEENYLKGDNLVAQEIREFGFEVKRFELPAELKMKVMAAQRRQGT